MSAPKFTPGPWHVNGRQSIRGSAGEYIARVNWKNGEANARLIAAAPELYEALEAAMASLEDVDCSTGYCMCGSPVDSHSWGDGHMATDMGEYHKHKALEAARAALAKARGESHG